ncbi:MAG: acetolactate synthase small subunit [Tissierellales bacterium]|jgi:acetolactate synthase-1/3 small subunit|nr:acetolactate synthase small subunit [Tissierellales bacterium]
MKSYVLSVTVDNNPGVLTRVCQLFNRRAYNLESVTAGVTENERISKLTLITKVKEDHEIEQVVKQLKKLENVHKVSRLTDANSLCKEIMFMKVSATAETRPQITSIVNIFKADIVDVAPEDVIIQVTGDESKLKVFQELMQPFGILEVVSSGYIAIKRGQEMRRY